MTGPAGSVRIDRGEPAAAEIAALLAVLLARGSAGAAQPDAPARRNLLATLSSIPQPRSWRWHGPVRPLPAPAGERLRWSWSAGDPRAHQPDRVSAGATELFPVAGSPVASADQPIDRRHLAGAAATRSRASRTTKEE